MEASAELPRYRCHKEVWALKIKSVERSGDIPGACWLVFEDARYATLQMPAEYVQKHDPKAGGYYVVYKDGYKSWSPADAFEEGYTLV